MTSIKVGNKRYHVEPVLTSATRVRLVDKDGNEHVVNWGELGKWQMELSTETKET